MSFFSADRSMARRFLALWRREAKEVGFLINLQATHHCKVSGDEDAEKNPHSHSCCPHRGRTSSSFMHWKGKQGLKSFHSHHYSMRPSLGHCLLHCNPRVIHGERLWKIPLEDHLFVGSLPWSRDVSYPRARHKLTACGGLAFL